MRRYFLLFLVIILISYTQNIYSIEKNRWVMVDSVDSFHWNLSALQCFDSVNCMGLFSYWPDAGFSVIRTTDAGESWKFVYSDFTDYMGIHKAPMAWGINYINPHHCYVRLDSGFVLSSKDNGDSWKTLISEDIKVLSFIHTKINSM